MQISRDPALYWNTLRHLRCRQIWYRLWYALTKAKPDNRAAPEVRLGKWKPHAFRVASMVGPDRFNFLNEERSSENWNSSETSLLWRYNLHYFDDLAAGDAVSRQAWHTDLIHRWVRDNPPGRRPGWDPFPTSLRIVNWVKYALSGGILSEEATRSLAVQARLLSSRVEWHILGNHVLANAKALIFAGSYFTGTEAARWFVQGFKILRAELEKQILSDGGHYERSPMYHALVLEDLLDLINLDQAYGRDTAQPILEVPRRMFAWLAAMTHPDRQLAFFNDAAFGIAPTLEDLKGYSEILSYPIVDPPRTGVVHLKDSGYVRVECGPAVAILDAAPLGPDYLPGHGHADTLSFELSLSGHRIFVNSGTGLYGESPERQRQRGTAAHNTLCVDGEDSSEVWAGFRVARRATPGDVAVRQDAGTVRVSSSHDGYTRLPGRVMHGRSWAFTPGNLEISDRLSGRFSSAIARYHFHPDVQLNAMGATVIALLPNGHVVEISFSPGARAEILDGTWHPEFGRIVGNRSIAVVLDGHSLVTSISW